MHAEGYRTRGVNPGSLTLSVGIVGGLLTVAMLSNTVIERIKAEKILTATNIALPKPPPPDDPPPPTQQRTRPVETPPIAAPERIVETQPTTDDFRVAVDPGPIVPLGTGEGLGGTGTVIDPPKPPPPVLTGAEVDPRYARDFQPVYPASERRAGNEGTVIVRVLIGVDGRVRDVQRVAAANDEFWAVTERQARGRWRFRPATRDGIPYETWRTMTVRFVLEG
jgi:periplasmic protein TonB